MKIQIENRQTLHKIERRKIRSAVSKIFKILECTDQHISILLRMMNKSGNKQVLSGKG